MPSRGESCIVICIALVTMVAAFKIPMSLRLACRSTCHSTGYASDATPLGAQYANAEMRTRTFQGMDTPKHNAAYLLQVAGGASGDLSISKDDLLCSATTQSAHDAGKDLLLADQGGILPRNKPSQTSGLASRNQCHLHLCTLSSTESHTSMKHT